MASDSYREAIDIQLKLVADHPFDQVYQGDLARTYNNLGYVYAADQDPQRASECYDKAIKLQLNLVKASRSTPYYCRELSVSYNNLGTTQVRLRHPADAEESFRSAIEQERLALSAQPDDPRTLSDLGGVYNNLAMALSVRRHEDEAAAAYREAISAQQKALASSQDSDAIRGLLNRHFISYARCLAKQGKLVEAAQATLDRKGLWRQNPQHLFAVAQDLVALWAESPANLRNDNTRDGLLTAAVDTLHEAVGAGLSSGQLHDASLKALARRADFRALASGAQ